MTIGTVVVGFLTCLYSVYTMIIRIKSPEKFGDSAGTIMHIIAYTVRPIFFGSIVMFSGFNGLSLRYIIII